MEVIQNISIAVVTSAVTVSLLVFIIKEYIKKLLDYEFSKRKLKTDSEEKNLSEIQSITTSKRYGIYPEILEIVYRVRNISKEAIDLKNPYVWNKAEFSELSYLLTESLYRYRAFLKDETFSDLHLFKRYSQEFLILTDYSDRPDLVNESLDYPDEVWPKIIRLSDELDKLYEKITSDIKKQLRID